MRVNLVTLCGQQVPTLAHMLQHYRPWVDDIYIIVHSLGERDPVVERVRAVADAVGCGVYKTIVARHFDPTFATQLYNDAMKERPDDWWIVADPDELHLYFDDIKTIIRDCEEHGWHFVGGHFLDRLGPGGTLPQLEPTDIWRQFPIAGITRSLVTNRVRGEHDGWAPGWKICLAKGQVRLGAGQHCVLKEDGVDGYPVRRGLVQVHHFKWDSTVLDRHRQTLDTLRSPDAEREANCRQSYQTMYDYLMANGGRVNVRHPSGRFAECPEPKFSAYPYWSDIVRHAPPFGLAVDFSSRQSLISFSLWRRPVLGQLYWWLCRLVGRT